MLQDGDTSRQQAVRPRQMPSSGSQSTSIPSFTTSTVPYAAISQVPTTGSILDAQLAFSTVTGEVDMGHDPCTAALPAGGIIQFNDTYTLYLDQSVSFVAQCGNHSVFCTHESAGANQTVLAGTDPFYSSTSPQVYALACATVISYLLVILIFITPRTFYVGGPGGPAGTAGPSSGFRTLFPGSGGRNSSVMTIGRRPLLQKIAALTVAVSLTIATADTFRVLEEQYHRGYLESDALVTEVIGSLEIRITRLVSDTFLWLAQVQTLIRLFPRHKEKVTIKWLGFGLVLCDAVFSILESFMSNARKTRPGSFTDAIPALSYLFELSIGLIYASCVLYYALSKRRYAFWHNKMRNVCLVALLSIIAVLIPVVFFITDLAQPDIATWGEYIRWVGAAAASVVVWEWVERIEALERDERKDGILGREIFDGDEMLDLTPSEEGGNPDRHAGPGPVEEKKGSKFWKNVRDLNIDIQPRLPLQKLKRIRKKAKDPEEKDVATIQDGPIKTGDNQITRPPQAVTPISRSDTNSAASTVYAVRYHDPFSPSPAIPEERVAEDRRDSMPINQLPAISDDSTLTNSTSTTMVPQDQALPESMQAISTGRQIWQGVSNPFKRKRAEPPAEVAAQIAESNSRRSPIDGHLNLKSRFNAFTAAQKGRFGSRVPRKQTPLAVTFIPAQPRGSRVDTEAGDEDDKDKTVNVDETDQTDQPTSPNSDMGSPNLASLPITVIPAPVRGGRTWSPDDLVHTRQTPSRNQAQSQNSAVTNPQFNTQPVEFTAGGQQPLSQSPPVAIHSQRGTLTISESPERMRDFNASSGNAANNRPASTSTSTSQSPNIQRRPRNTRSATLTSIDNRLDSVSPGTISGVGSTHVPTSSGTRTVNTDTSRAGDKREHGKEPVRSEAADTQDTGGMDGTEDASQRQPS